MAKDLSIFVIERKFGTRCEFQDLSGTSITTIRGAYNPSVGGLFNLSNEIVTSSSQLFTHVDPYTL